MFHPILPATPLAMTFFIAIYESGQASRWTFQGRALRMTACVPPSKDCAPKKLTGSGLL